MKAILPSPALLLALASISHGGFLDPSGGIAPPPQGYRIEVRIDGYQGEQLHLAYPLLDKTFARDSVRANAEGFFVFRGDEPLPGGLYSLAMGPPDRKHFNVLIDSDEQQFRIVTNVSDPVPSMEVTGSIQNDLFYEYLAFLAHREARAGEINTELDRGDLSDARASELNAELEALRAELSAYRVRLAGEHPGTLLASVLIATTAVPVPEFSGDDAEVQEQRLRYLQEHWFDHIDLGDPRMLRTTFLFQRVDDFVNRLHVQHPDTLAKAIDDVLARMKPSEETFRAYVQHFLNTYARSNIVGMDAVYVHLALEYYATGQTPWVDAGELERIVANARRLEPILINKIAPDFTLERRDGTRTRLTDVESEYTVLFFWNDDCGPCTRMIPDLEAFRERHAAQGVEIAAVCTKRRDEVSECWDFVDENGIADWIHGADPPGRSEFRQAYDLRFLPQIFLLGPDKVILSKRIAADQLESVFEQVIGLR